MSHVRLRYSWMFDRIWQPSTEWPLEVRLDGLPVGVFTKKRPQPLVVHAEPGNHRLQVARLPSGSVWHDTTIEVRDSEFTTVVIRPLRFTAFRGRLIPGALVIGESGRARRPA